ncbi:monooxygenase [Massarina eburnea CBS 473.64]|uniref:Monooxygenase n=1 Tax=Massarina eburnea CBS 473.64 TaxID=1395130 RepID=A0A6A6SBF9_9PLEO|nr:monooxygenase [Massarina eburnea CBS 473.64]
MANPFQAGLMPTAGIAALSGVVFHLSIPIRNAEFEVVMFPFIVGSCFAFLSFAWSFAQFGGYGSFGALAKTVWVAICFNTGLLTSIGVYRLVFHRLRSFPGPFWAKLTKFHAAYRASQAGQLHRERAELHKKYGDVVRVGPREVSVMRKSAVQLIYGPGTDCVKSTWYAQAGNDHTITSLHMERNRPAHRLRRRAWDRGFSTKACASYEPRIEKLADRLVEQIRETNCKPIDGTKWSMFYSFDIMGTVAFQKDFNQTTSGTEHIAIKGIHDTMGLIGVLGNTPWTLVLASCLPGAASGFARFFTICATILKEKEKSYDPEENPQDVLAFLLKAAREGDQTAPPTRKALEDDIRLMIVAGSETSATTIAYQLYYLAKCPDKQQKLREKLFEAMPGGPSTWTHAALKNVPYLDDFINETLRLKPATVLGCQRETSEKGLRIDDDIYIPPHTTVMVPMQGIQTDPRYWPEADSFVPERWGERREEMGTDGAPFFAFCMGAHSCAGKAVAMISMRTALSKLVMEFDVAFAPGEDGVEFDTMEEENFSTTCKPLQLVFTPRS